MLYKVCFECDGRIVFRTQMVYVAFPGHHLVLGSTRYKITDITWTPGAACHYILSLEAVEDAPEWALRGWAS